ncbi:uncharacterized protein ARMOST_20157 [Armillaria ostoyae]|uniref:Uncharacterized protein n=1 Tax=Armillaria ostoyae TaxID=47428 RepID=A0A284S6K5_ARMOS|nr:uncharacterized protein ARMOST_20157 [Armillaria ostoyae]
MWFEDAWPKLQYRYYRKVFILDHHCQDTFRTSLVSPLTYPVVDITALLAPLSSSLECIIMHSHERDSSQSELSSRGFGRCLL